ncbi:transmembrane protein 87A [Teleopsis dalmanni]|uniref:transmembrane protein 87A n=1 Tax=Teleopsis dalmanni TaxID=139649 RepID=UPI0018CEF840|nr:transmembrane protein 87A [Teleopsis dalmanni]
MLTREIIFPIILWLAAFGLLAVNGKSDPGKTNTVLNRDYNVDREQRPLLANSKICVKIACSSAEPMDIVIFWTLTEMKCWDYKDSFQSPYISYDNGVLQPNKSNDKIIISPKLNAECPQHRVVLAELQGSLGDGGENGGGNAAGNGAADGAALKAQNHPISRVCKPIVTVSRDGIYDFALTIKPMKDNIAFTASVDIEMLGPHGYISASDWPLLPFYGIMCIVYVIFGIIWLIVSFMQWRDLLRIQFWIGGVILLGMLEKAFFYAQYQSLNNTGVPVQGAELAAEFVSCAKRTLARMLVIIMSLGFGIVKPRLGPMLHRVVGVGALYFVLACVESYLRVMSIKPDNNELLVASIPLAVLDTGICWWIFTSLVQTTRTLRLRRNMVKLSLYRHFTNTLIFSVIASVIFMVYALHLRNTQKCTPGWHNIWIDTAFWHVLFSVLLLVIMILWRPTNNNQRYAFTPLLDNPEDEDDEDEEDQFVADAYGVKMRGTHSNGARTPPSTQRATTTEEDDLRWVEENIPSSMADPALPVLDSDEEIINTKFEVSKMQ